MTRLYTHNKPVAAYQDNIPVYQTSIRKGQADTLAFLINPANVEMHQHLLTVLRVEVVA